MEEVEEEFEEPLEAITESPQVQVYSYEYMFKHQSLNLCLWILPHSNICCI
jgi:hypothetical protein